MDLKYKYLISYSIIIILLLLTWVLPKFNDDILTYININEKRLHSIIFTLLSFIIISNIYIYPTKDIKNSLIHENIYVYYFIMIFIIFNMLHELFKLI